MVWRHPLLHLPGIDRDSLNDCRRLLRQSCRDPSWSKQSEAIRQHKRAMMLPQKILRMDRAREMVFRAGMAPALVDKIRWFDDPVLKRRYVPAPFVEPIEIVVPMDDGGLVDAE